MNWNIAENELFVLFVEMGKQIQLWYDSFTFKTLSMKVKCPTLLLLLWTRWMKQIHVFHTTNIFFVVHQLWLTIPLARPKATPSNQDAKSMQKKKNNIFEFRHLDQLLMSLVRFHQHASLYLHHFISRHTTKQSKILVSMSYFMLWPQFVNWIKLRLMFSFSCILILMLFSCIQWLKKIQENFTL